MFASGTRLAVTQLASPEMPSLFVTFHDTELDTDCDFTTASDGSLRCLPRFQSTTPILSPVWFLDADCTEPVAIGDPTCVPESAPFTEEFLPGDACSSRRRILRTTRLADGVALFSNESGDCVANGTTNQVYHYFSVTEEDPETFVEGELSIVPTPTRLSVQRIVAEDGAYLTQALADPRTERECRAFERDGASICVPAVEFSARGYRYADESCETPLSLSACEPPLFVVDFDEAANGFVFFHAGPEHTGDVYGGVSTCDIVTGEGPFYAVGEPIAASEFPSVTAAYEGSGRLRQYVYRDASGTALAAGSASGVQILNDAGLFDSEFDAPCSLYRGPDLERYCIPHDVPFESSFNYYFADADCTEQLSLCGDHGCPADLAVRHAMGEGAVCGVAPDFSEFFTLGDEVELDEIYIYYSGREPGTECDGPFSTEGYGILREITGVTSENPFARAPLAP